MNQISIKLPLIGNCVIYIKDKKLADFSCRQLQNYITQSINVEPCKDTVDTILKFKNEHVVKTFREYCSQNVGLSRSLKWKENTLKDGYYQYKVGSELIVKCRMLLRKSDKIKNVYNRIKNISEEGKYGILGGVFYKTVLFPILSVYAAAFGLYCVHGSLIHLKNNRTIIVSGLDGVGKSSLSDMICKMKGNKLLADNIVLFDGKKALNLNLAMRLEVDVETKRPVIYKNKNIKEVLPEEIGYGLCKVDHIYALLRGNITDKVIRYENKATSQYWMMLMERAPEIQQANNLLGPWLFVFDLFHKGNEVTIPIVTMSIPNGKLEMGKEVILNELKIFD